jgi:hypothetical protein
VHFNKSSRKRPFELKVWVNGRDLYLGHYATAEEAALMYSRRLGREAAEAEAARAAAAAVFAVSAAPEMTSADALAQARAEGLELCTALNRTGYKNVTFNKDRRTKPYELQVSERGRSVSLGRFATPEEAALEFARRVRRKLSEARGGRAPPWPTPPREPSVSSEQNCLAESGGGGGGGRAARGRAATAAATAAATVAAADSVGVDGAVRVGGAIRAAVSTPLTAAGVKRNRPEGEQGPAALLLSLRHADAET